MRLSETYSLYLIALFKFLFFLVFRSCLHVCTRLCVLFVCLFSALAEEEQYYRDPSPAKHEPSTRFRPFPFHVSRHKPDTWPEVLISKWNDQARLHAEDLRRPVWERYFGSSASGRSFKEIYFGHAPQSKEYWEKKKVQWAEQDGATSTH